MTAHAWRAAAIRWLKFNLVGGIGIAVQLLMLVVLKTGLHLDYLIATALAVETTVVHNFLWHERFTWADAGRLRRIKLHSLPQVQPDHRSVLDRWKPRTDEATGRRRTHELPAGQWNHHRCVLIRQLCGE
jgi:hypothetical protein